LRLAQHGFARSEIWEFERLVTDNQTDVSVQLSLGPNEAIRAVYSQPFKLVYNVVLGEQHLSTILCVENTSQELDTLEFQALLHNYIRVPADEVKITPLKGLTYYDKTESTDEGRAVPKIESREEVTVSEYTDSVYEDGSLDYNISWPHRILNLKVKNFKDIVIWNPQQEGRKIGDMEPDGWKKYVCVEPGFVRGYVRLEPGQCWIGEQVLSITS